MKHRVAINGFGRIGRSILRALYESGHHENIKIVAVNELSNMETITHLTKYDSTHGRFPGVVSSQNSTLSVNGDPIHVSFEKNISDLDWGALEIDVVLECTGRFSKRRVAEKHLASGAKKVIFSQPAERDVDATIVYGINDETLSQGDVIISNASCTTNCIIPVLKTLEGAFGIDCGMITTIHSMMNDQPVIDAYHHQDLRRTRSAAQSIIPVDTELAKGIGRIMPALSGKFEAIAMRVPTVNVSAMDLTVTVQQDTSAEEVNQALEKATHGRLSGILGYTEEPLASCDFNHDSHSSIVDGHQTRVCGKRIVKVVAWFDNEWGYANRMLDTTVALMRADR
jgi:D-erythrose 4-phosphate dehydrogenase